MKRFFFENEDDDDDDMMDESGRPMPDFIPEFLAMAHQEDPARHLLDCAIRVCEKSFFWRFMNYSKKTEMIENVFYDLRELVEPRMDQDSAEEEK